MENISIEKEVFEEFEKKLKCLNVALEKLYSKHNKRMSEWIDNTTVCSILNICMRKLQTYRDNCTIPYSQINGKIFYKRTDIIEVLERFEVQKYLGTRNHNHNHKKIK